MKQINDINLGSLASGLGQLLKDDLGGDFDVTVQKMERTNPRFIDDRLVLSFIVKDVDHMDRYSASKEGRLHAGFFGEAETVGEETPEQ